jgi:hypothetical protein
VYRALRCLVLLTAVSLGAAPAHAQGPILEAVKKAQFEQTDTGPKSIRVIFFGFTEDASKECGLDVDRIKGAIQSVVDLRGLTVATGAKPEADIQLQLQTVREFDVCVTLLQLGLSAEGTSALPFRTSDPGKEVVIQACAGVSINPSATPTVHADAVDHQIKDLATRMIYHKW